MHFAFLTLFILSTSFITVSSPLPSALPIPQLPSQHHPLTPRQLLKIHKKNTPYCTPTTSKIADTNTCTYVWETFYNSQAVVGRRKWNTGIVYQGNGCVVLATDREALSYAIKTKTKPSRRALSRRDSTSPLVPLTSSDFPSNNNNPTPNKNPNPSPNEPDTDSLAQNTSTIALTLSNPKSSIPEDPSLHLPLYTFPLTFPTQRNTGAKIVTLGINPSSQFTGASRNPNPSLTEKSDTITTTGMNTKAKPYPPPSTQYFPSQNKPLLRVSYEDTTGQGMLYEGSGVFPVLELVRFDGGGGNGRGVGKGKGERVGGGEDGCECSGDENVAGLGDYATWVCVCGFECGGL